jgi:hypothetical protein
MDNSTTRSWVPPRCGKNRNNDAARRWVLGSRYFLTALKIGRTAQQGGGYLLVVLKTGIMTQRDSEVPPCCGENRSNDTMRR